jgi:hypothetical protein
MFNFMCSFKVTAHFSDDNLGTDFSLIFGLVQYTVMLSRYGSLNEIFKMRFFKTEFHFITDRVIREMYLQSSSSAPTTHSAKVLSAWQVTEGGSVTCYA